MGEKSKTEQFEEKKCECGADLVIVNENDEAEVWQCEKGCEYLWGVGKVKKEGE